MARTKRKELEKEAKRKGELSQKNPNVEKSVAASPLLLPQNSSNCTGSAVKFDSSLGQSLSLPKQWELPKHKAVVVQTESHVANKEYQLPSKDGTLCNRGGEATKFEHVSPLQASHPHAPLSTLQKLNICDDGFMSESVGDTRPLTDSGGKVGSIKKSQSMTVTSSKRVLFPASLSSPSQLPRAVVCVEDICKSPDGNILKIMKRQSSKEPSETEGASSGLEQNLVEFGDLLVKNSATDFSLTGDRTVSSTSTTKNIFEQFDTEIIGRRSPRLRSNSPRGNYSQGSPVFQDMSSRSNSEERQHSNIVSAVRALRGISEKVSEVRSQTRVRNQESKLVSLVISDSKETSPESLSPQRHSPQGSADMNPPELAIKAPKAKKTPPSPTPVENCETSPSGVKRGRSPRNLSDDIPSPQVSSQKFDRGEECLSISSQCRKKPKMDGVASEDALPSFQILSSTSVPAHLPFKGVQSEPQATSSLKTSEQVCLNADLHSKDSGARKACAKSGYSRSFRIISSTSPQGHLSSKGMQRDPQAPSSFATSEQVCLSADSHKDLGVRKISCAKPSEEAIDTHSLSSQLYPQSQISGAVECAEGMEPSLLCAMLIGGSEVAKTYEKSREHVHANVPNMPRQQEPVALSSSSDSVVDDLLNGELTMDHLDAQTPYELPLLSHLPPLVKPNLGVLDLTLKEPVPFEEENVFVYKKNVVLLELISKVTDYLKQLGTIVDGSVIEDAEKALFEDGSKQKQLPFRIETSVIASEQGMTSSQSDFKLNCDAHNKNLPQETRCENLTADSSTYSPVNTVAINGMNENSGIDSDKKNSVEAHQPITEQMQGSVQDKPDIDLAHINERTAESCLAGEKQKSIGELDTVIAKGTNQTAPRMLLALPSSNKDLVKAVEKNKNVSDLNTFVDQSTASGTSEPVGEPDKIFPESNSTTTTSSREVKSGEISEDPGTSRPQWQPKVPSGSHTGRPLWSRWHKIVLPSPLHILSRPEQPSINKRLSPFISKELDAYLRKHSNRLIVPAGPKSKLAKILILHGFFKDYLHLEAELNKHSDFGHCSGDDCPGRSDEDEEGDDEERDDFPQKFEPDFDEVDGLVFMSFANETAMESHIQVEKDLKWDKEPNAFLNIARFRAFEESRREDGTSRRESQGLRGQHMRWRKYQRMYRKEFRGRLEAKEKGLPWPLPRIPHKTSDVSKIKNWKRKLERDGIKTEDASGSQNPVCAGSDAASHKKKKRKTYVFSVKKKSKKSAPVAERVFNVSTVSDHDVDDRSMEGAMEGAICPSDVRSAEEEDDYGKPIPIDQDGYMEDVQNSLKEMEQKQKGIMLNKTLLGHLRMGPEDCEIFKKLGGWVTCQKPIKKGSGDKKSRNQTISLVTTGDLGNEMKTQRKSKASFILDRVREERAREAVLAVRRYDDVRDAHSSLQFSSDSNDMSLLSEGGDFMDLTGDSPSPTSSHKAKYSCDKPGCRYGCICHLCQSIGESDDLEQGVSATSQGRACDKEYCRLGCICESLEKSSKRSSPLHCRKPECVLECQCLKEVPCTSESPHPLVKAEADDVEKNLHIELKSEPVDLAESSGDELPTLEKTNSRRQRSLDRYSNLPRRQTSYRIAKNLDAVSRKAMMLYETSEIYWEQSCNRRKKSADSPGSSAAVPFTANNTVSTYSDTIPITPDPCTSPPAATTLTLLSPFSRQGLTHAATAEQSQACIPVNIPFVTTSSGMTPVPTSFKSPSTLGSDMCGQNHQKANQELSPVVISDDEGHANKMSSIQNQLDSPKSTKMKLFSSEPTAASSSTQQSVSPRTTTSTLPASTPLLASVASGPSLTGLVSSAFSQPRWHTSMVCLRANPPGKEKKDTSDDVQEEDEIKLLEFIANCNWDSAKKNILLQVAQCLSRAQYPSPRTMFVGDFRVEILPKASKPSVIPPELRSKLPEMMYSIRVRVTPYRNASTPSPHPVGLFRNAATPAGISVVPVPTGVIPLAVSTPLKSPNKPDDLREKFSQSSFGISGLGQLQINHNTSPSSLSLQGESVQMQGKKTKKRGDPDSADSQQSGKRKRKKEKKKKVDVEESSNRAADTKNKKESSPGAIKVPIISTTQSFPISKLMPLIPGVSSHQVIGPVANLKDLKFIQLPGQKSLLQLLPASALGIKPSPDGKGSPQFLAVPVPIAPVPLKGDSKRGGTKMQVDVVASAHAFSGGTQNSTQPVGGPVQLSVPLQESSAADSNISSKKKKKKKKKKKEEKVKTSVTSRNSTNICRSGSTTSTTMPAPDASSVSVPSGFREQSAPCSLQVVPSVCSPGSRLEGVTVGLKTPPPISSVLFGNQIISITSPGRQGTTGGGEQVMAASRAKPDLTASSGCRDPSKVAPEKTVSLLANNKSLLSTAARILSSTSPGPEGSAGEKVPPTVNSSQKSSATFADDYLTQLKTKTSRAKKKSQLLLATPKQNRSPEKEGKFVDEDSLASVGSQGSGSSNSLFLSEEDSADLEQENQMSGESNLVSEQTSFLTVSREREKCIVPRSKHKSRVHLVHKQREKNRRAEHYQMFQHLKNILFSIDPDRKLLPPLPKTKLLSKAELVVKYHVKRSQSLEKTYAVEQKRHALLKQQLDTKIDDLKQEGAAEEIIMSILDSLNVSHLPRVPLDNRLSVEEQRLLASDHAVVGVPSNRSTAASDSHSSCSTRLRSGSVASMLLSPWHVDHLTGSVVSSEESNSSQPISITSTSRSASPAGSQPKEKRRKSCKPVKLRSKLSSQFVIEIERADEDVGFMDGENNDCRVQQTQEDTDSFAINDGEEPSERLKQTLQQQSSTFLTADVRGSGDALEDGDPGVKVIPPDHGFMSTHGVHAESKVAARAGVQEQTDTANSDTVNLNLDLNPYVEAVGKGCPHDFLPAADVDSDVQ